MCSFICYYIIAGAVVVMIKERNPFAELSIKLALCKKIQRETYNIGTLSVHVVDKQIGMCFGFHNS